MQSILIGNGQDENFPLRDSSFNPMGIDLPEISLSTSIPKEPVSGIVGRKEANPILPPKLVVWYLNTLREADGEKGAINVVGAGEGNSRHGLGSEVEPQRLIGRVIDVFNTEQPPLKRLPFAWRPSQDLSRVNTQLLAATHKVNAEFFNDRNPLVSVTPESGDNAWPM